MIKNIKQIHPKDIILVEVGKFYYAYGKDAYILSYMFQYKLTKIPDIRTELMKHSKIASSRV